MRRDSQSGRNLTDLVIFEILDGVRQPTDADTETIIARMATAPFDGRPRTLPKPLADLTRRHGYALPPRPTELTHHWAKHVLGDEQWASSTDETAYFHDLQKAVIHRDARLLLYRPPSGRSRAIRVVDTVDVIPSRRLGPQYGPDLVVVYSADTGKILSGYMTRTLLRVTSRPGTIWLRR